MQHIYIMRTEYVLHTSCFMRTFIMRTWTYMNPKHTIAWWLRQLNKNFTLFKSKKIAVYEGCFFWVLSERIQNSLYSWNTGRLAQLLLIVSIGWLWCCHWTGLGSLTSSSFFLSEWKQRRPLWPTIIVLIFKLESLSSSLREACRCQNRLIFPKKLRG